MNQQPTSVGSTLQENLQRLSNLMVVKKGNNNHEKLTNQRETLKKTIFVNLRSFTKQVPDKIEPKPYKCIPDTTTTQSQTPTTLTKVQMFRPQSLTMFKSKDTMTQQFSQLMSGQSQLVQQADTSIKTEQPKYRDWVGLTVIDRTELFLKKKRAKLLKLKKQQDSEALSYCTFTPKLSQQIKFHCSESQIISKSYLDLHKLKQNYNEKLY